MSRNRKRLFTVSTPRDTWQVWVPREIERVVAFLLTQAYNSSGASLDGIQDSLDALVIRVSTIESKYDTLATAVLSVVSLVDSLQDSLESFTDYWYPTVIESVINTGGSYVVNLDNNQKEIVLKFNYTAGFLHRINLTPATIGSKAKLLLRGNINVQPTVVVQNNGNEIFEFTFSGTGGDETVIDLIYFSTGWTIVKQGGI